MEGISRYDFFGPFQVSQNKAYIKHKYVPYEMGTVELEKIIRAKIAALESEKSKWVALDLANRNMLQDQRLKTTTEKKSNGL